MSLRTLLDFRQGISKLISDHDQEPLAYRIGGPFSRTRHLLSKWFLTLPTEKLKYPLFVSYTNMESDLKKQAKRVFHSAELVYKDEDYTSATILYFKALFIALDFFSLSKI